MHIETKLLPVPLVTVNPKTQMRVRGLIAEWVGSMKESLKERWDKAEEDCAAARADNVLDYFDAPFPPITVFFDGSEYYLADGAHRLESFKQLDIPIINASVHTGGLRDAVMFAFSANGDAAHGEKRSDGDKRKAALCALQMAEEEGVNWSDREIARLCQVSHTYVAGMRRIYDGSKAYGPGETPVKPDAVRVGADGRAVNMKFRVSKKKAGADATMMAEDWLETIPVWKTLNAKSSGCLGQFENDALSWRAMQISEDLPKMQKRIKRGYDVKLGATTPMERVMFPMATLPHPKDWALCPCNGAGCDNCGHSGYQLWFGRKGDLT